MIIGADSSFFCECGGIKRAGESKCWDCKRLGHLHIPMDSMYTTYRKGGGINNERRKGLRPITTSNYYKEDALATVQAEVKELVDVIRSYGFTAAIESDSAYHIYKDGKAVISDTGRPITIHTTPSDNRWYRNTVAMLIRSKVLPADPKKEGQMRKAREERPEEMEAARRRLSDKIVAVRQRERDRDKPIIDAALKLRRDLEATHLDMVKFLIQVAKEQGIEAPTERGVTDHVYKLLNGKIEAMSPTYRRLWKAMFKHFNVDTANMPADESAEPKANVTPAKGHTGRRAVERLVEKEHTAPENPGPNQCAICGFEAKDLRGLRAHERGHRTTVCPYCHNTYPLVGIGQHKKYCDKNPANVKTLRVTHVEPEKKKAYDDALAETYYAAYTDEEPETGVQVMAGEEVSEVSSPVTSGNEDQVRSAWGNSPIVGQLMKDLYEMDRSKFLMFLLNSDMDKNTIVELIQLLSD